MRRNIFVIGHKNPDTDSICSAIAYAYLKNQKEPGLYIPKRAGHVNEETQYVLERFKMEVPDYVSNVEPQVKDIEIRHTEGVESSISLKKAYALMREKEVVTLPITKENVLEGLITVNDIAESYMDIYDNTVLGTARTQYRNILETLDGTLIVGNEHGYVTKGKVLIAAANPDLMENYIEQDDVVILGNRYESQLCAIEMNAACIIVCEGAKVSRTICKLAEERECAVISTPHDTYTVARLINQSMPVKYFMKAEHLLTVKTEEPVETARNMMAKARHRDFPVIDMHGTYVGMISRRNLLNLQRKQLILVDHNETSQAVDGVEDAEILEIIDHHRLGSLETMAPVFFRNQPLGCTATIISMMFEEQQVEIPTNIAGLLCAAILSDTLVFRSPTCTDKDRAAAESLAKKAGIEIHEFAHEMFRAGSNLLGKAPEEIFYQDFKKFNIGEVSFGVGQINSMDREELWTIKEKLLPYMEKAYGELRVNMIYFMLTDIIRETTYLIYHGDNADTLAEEAFGQKNEDDTFVLEGVVSRKKQFIPAFILALQQ